MLRWEEVPARLGAREKGPPAENPFRLEAGKCVPERRGEIPARRERYRPQEREGPALPKAKWNRELHRFVDVCASAGRFILQ
mgnify:CR=1 FL=1